MDRALRGLSWSRGDRYHDVSADDPRGRLEPGAIDDEGALRLGVPQTTYRGFVCDLQSDLRRFGFNPGRIDGIFGPATERAVRFFQEAALTCTHRRGGMTFTGAINGHLDDATRAEISIWRQRGFTRHMDPLTAERSDRIILAVAEALYGPRALSRISNHPEKGLVYGLLDFDQHSGALGDLVWSMWSASPRSFRFIFKLGGEESATTLLTSPDVEQRMRLDLSSGPWTSRFAKAGEIGFWARCQLALARARRLDPVLLLAARAGLRHESAIAALLLVMEATDVGTAVAAVSALGRRPPGTPAVTHLARLPGLLRSMGEKGTRAAAKLETMQSETDLDDCALLSF